MDGWMIDVSQKTCIYLHSGMFLFHVRLPRVYFIVGQFGGVGRPNPGGNGHQMDDSKLSGHIGNIRGFHWYPNKFQSHNLPSGKRSVPFLSLAGF